MGRRISLAALADEDDIAPPRASRAGAPTAGARRSVGIEEVAGNPLNPRPPGVDDEIAGLADTMRESGIIQPLIVCSVTAFTAAAAAAVYTRFPPGVRWVVLIGNRRLMAAGAAGLVAVDVVIDDARATAMDEVALVENGQRRDLPAVWEAEAMARALRTAGISQRELARRIGKSPAHVTQRLALLRLVPELRALVEAGAVTVEQARKLVDLSVDEQRGIAVAGPPYRPGVHGVNTGERPAPRTIRIGATPAAAAESIRARFAPEDLAELIDLLSTGGRA